MKKAVIRIICISISVFLIGTKVFIPASALTMVLQATYPPYLSYMTLTDNSNGTAVSIYGHAEVSASTIDAYVLDGLTIKLTGVASLNPNQKLVVGLTSDSNVWFDGPAAQTGGKGIYFDLRTGVDSNPVNVITIPDVGSSQFEKDPIDDEVIMSFRKNPSGKWVVSVNGAEAFIPDTMALESMLNTSAVHIAFGQRHYAGEISYGNLNYTVSIDGRKADKTPLQASYSPYAQYMTLTEKAGKTDVSILGDAYFSANSTYSYPLDGLKIKLKGLASFNPNQKLVVGLTTGNNVWFDGPASLTGGKGIYFDLRTGDDNAPINVLTIPNTGSFQFTKNPIDDTAEMYFYKNTSGTWKVSINGVEASIPSSIGLETMLDTSAVYVGFGQRHYAGELSYGNLNYSVSIERAKAVRTPLICTYAPYSSYMSLIEGNDGTSVSILGDAYYSASSKQSYVLDGLKVKLTGVASLNPNQKLVVGLTSNNNVWFDGPAAQTGGKGIYFDLRTGVDSNPVNVLTIPDVGSFQFNKNPIDDVVEMYFYKNTSGVWKVSVNGVEASIPSSIGLESMLDTSAVYVAFGQRHYAGELAYGNLNYTVEIIPTYQAKQYYKDSGFNNGATLHNLSRTQTAPLNFGYTTTASPSWDIVQYISKYDLISASLQYNSDGSRQYANTGKMVKMYTHNGDKVLRLDVYAGQEYTSPRQSSDPWPGLLLEQNLALHNAYFLSELSSLTYSMDVKINYSTNLMGGSYDPNLHCAQTTAFFTVQNLNPSSPGYGQYIWFGLPIFDSRYTFPSLSTGFDSGTGMMLYSPGGTSFLNTHYSGVNPGSGNWAHLNVNILPYIQTALQTAHNNGYMTNTTYNDLRIGGFNIGWEVPGTFDCSMDIKNIKMLAIANK